jgi:hypothetical protein
MPTVFANATYLLISLGIMIGVERTFHSSGRKLLIQVFDGNEEQADSINRLLAMGFYLVGSGIATIAMAYTDPLTTTTQAIESIAGRIGWMLLVVGLLHLLNLQIISRLQPRTRQTPRRPLRVGPVVDHILD